MTALKTIFFLLAYKVSPPHNKVRIHPKFCTMSQSACICFVNSLSLSDMSYTGVARSATHSVLHGVVHGKKDE